jgi:hypothetical protein
VATTTVPPGFGDVSHGDDEDVTDSEFNPSEIYLWSTADAGMQKTMKTRLGTRRTKEEQKGKEQKGTKGRKEQKGHANIL